MSIDWNTSYSIGGPLCESSVLWWLRYIRGDDGALGQSLHSRRI